MQECRLTVTPGQSMINGKNEVPHDNQGSGLSSFPFAIGSEDKSPEKPGLDEKILPTTESQTPIGPSLSQALTLASEEVALLDDSVVVEMRLKKATNNAILADSSLDKQETGENEVNVFDAVSQSDGDSEGEEDLLDKSAIIPDPEINIRFDDPFIDESRWSLTQRLDFCSKKLKHLRARMTAVRRSNIAELKRLAVKLDYYLKEDITLVDLNGMIENMNFEDCD